MFGNLFIYKKTCIQQQQQQQESATSFIFVNKIAHIVLCLGS